MKTSKTKRNKVLSLDPNNVRNPFANNRASSVKIEADATDLVSTERKRKTITQVNLTMTPDGETDNLDTSPPLQVAVKEEPNFNLYVGSEMGMLKGIATGGELPISKSIIKPGVLDKKPPGVVCLTWTDETEKELLVCFSNHVVKTYNTKLKSFTRQAILDVEPNKDRKVIGLCCQTSSKYVFGLDDGTVCLWDCLNTSVTLTLKSCKETCGNSKQKPDLRQIRQCTADANFYATGGNENDLKIWNIGSETPQVPVFKAKNLPHDFLELRHPVWIQDLTFLPRTTEVVAVGTRYGQIRLYDVRASERPVSNVQFADHPIMAITSTLDDRKVVVGTAKGEAGCFDLRNPGKEKLCLKYRGFQGSIRSMAACPDQPYFVSSGLDRYLYIHKLSENLPVKKLYLSQQINCIALSKSFMKETSKSESSLKQSDWANIPPDVLNVTIPDVTTPSPTKKVRKGIRS